MKVLIADKFENEGIEQLQALGCEVMSNPDLQGEALTEAVGKTGCRVLIVRSTEVTEATIKAGKELGLIIRAGSGYNTIDVTAASAADVSVANCPGMNSVAVAELAMGLILALDRRIVHNVVDLQKGVWNKKEYSKARGLKGRMLGIVGMGRIGYEIARRAHAFEMNLCYSDVITAEKAEKEFGIRKVPLETLLKESDFVTLHVPYNDETKHMISTKQFEMMKPTAHVINCSRGGVIDEKALAAALESGQITGAGLDVYEIEPGASDKQMKDPVVNLDRVYGTHHIGASTEQAQLAVAGETVAIVKEYMNSAQVRNCVNPQ